MPVSNAYLRTLAMCFPRSLDLLHKGGLGVLIWPAFPSTFKKGAKSGGRQSAFKKANSQVPQGSSTAERT
jgi:hypothetical protein